MLKRVPSRVHGPPRSPAGGESTEPRTEHLQGKMPFAKGSKPQETVSADNCLLLCQPRES